MGVGKKKTAGLCNLHENPFNTDIHNMNYIC